MYVKDLPRNCLEELKASYVSALVNEGCYGEVVFDDATIESPSWGDMADIDTLIPDEIVFEHYEGVSFEKDDFFCMEDVSYEEWEAMENGKEQ